MSPINKSDYSTGNVNAGTNKQGPVKKSLRPTLRPSSVNKPSRSRPSSRYSNLGNSGKAEGGLVGKPASKNKKQTTQRRKGLGTRP